MSKGTAPCNTIQHRKHKKSRITAQRHPKDFFFPLLLTSQPLNRPKPIPRPKCKARHKHQIQGHINRIDKLRTVSHPHKKLHGKIKEKAAEQKQLHFFITTVLPNYRYFFHSVSIPFSSILFSLPYFIRNPILCTAERHFFS